MVVVAGPARVKVTGKVHLCRCVPLRRSVCVDPVLGAALEDGGVNVVAPDVERCLVVGSVVVTLARVELESVCDAADELLERDPGVLQCVTVMLFLVCGAHA
ncbi:hypothetical protein GCM10010201_33910 [Pilimelia columellifera subsp. columellifera]|uniref:Uncharacterized protein n=1 Tax=Pilimelia columellifera subsp. columellifera TaxID=706583 RepID=A0ABP6B215_9ACTN